MYGLTQAERMEKEKAFARGLNSAALQAAREEYEQREKVTVPEGPHLTQSKFERPREDVPSSHVSTQDVRTFWASMRKRWAVIF